MPGKPGTLWGEQRGQPANRRRCRTGAHAVSRVLSSLPAGCHTDGESGRRDGRATRTSTRSICTPATSASRVAMVVLRNLTCVAHAGSSTSTSSTPSSRRTGRTCAATRRADRVVPAAEDSPDLDPVGSAQRLHDGVERPRDRNGFGHAVQRSGQLGSTSPETRPATTRTTWSACAAGGSSLAVVMTTCPAGR